MFPFGREDPEKYSLGQEEEFLPDRKNISFSNKEDVRLGQEGAPLLDQGYLFVRSRLAPFHRSTTIFSAKRNGSP